MRRIKECPDCGCIMQDLSPTVVKIGESHEFHCRNRQCSAEISVPKEKVDEESIRVHRDRDGGIFVGIRGDASIDEFLQRVDVERRD